MILDVWRNRLEKTFPRENSGVTRELAAIMFTDIAGYTSMTQRNEGLTLALLAEHRTILRSIFSSHNGHEIETAGDSFFVRFPSALEAVNCAVEIQHALHARNETCPRERVVQVRIGLHLGDVVMSGNHVHGDMVNMASRLLPLAPPGGIIISEDIEHQVHNKAGQKLVWLGRPLLKHIDKKVGVFRIVLPWENKSAVALFVERLKFLWKETHLPRYAIAGSMLLVVVAALVLYSIMTSCRRDTATVAILPFENHLEEGTYEYMPTGLEEELINGLRPHSRYARVTTAVSAQAYADPNLSNRDKAEKLGVRYIVFGQLHSSVGGMGMSASFEIYDSAGNAPIFTGSRTLAIASLWIDQRQILNDILGALRICHTDAAIHIPEQNAYLAYLDGLYHLDRDPADEKRLALRKLSDAIERDSMLTRAYIYLAHAQVDLYENPAARQRRLLDDARSNCLKALLLDTASASGYAELGRVEWMEGSEDKALLHAKRAHDLDPYNYTALTILGSLAFNTDPQTAGTYFQSAIDIEPHSSELHSNLAATYAMRKDFPAAANSLRKAYLLKPTNLDLLNNIGLFYESQGIYDSAVVYYTLLTQRDSLNPQRCESLIQVLLVRQQYAAATNVLEHAMRLMPRRHELYYLLGVVRKLGGNSSAAAEQFRQGLKLVQQSIAGGRPTSADFGYEGLFYARLGDGPKALASGLQSVQSDTLDGEVLFRYCRIAAVLGRKDLLLKAFERAKRQYPGYDQQYLMTAIDFENCRNDPDLLALAR